MGLDAGGRILSRILVFVLLATLIGKTSASLGDHLPEFKECVKVMTGLAPGGRRESAHGLLHRSVKRRIVKMEIRRSLCLPTLSVGLLSLAN